MAHEFSGFTVNGIRKALETLNFAGDVVPALSAAAQESLSKGSVFKFQPGAAMDEVLLVVGRKYGVDGIAAVMEEATRSSIEGVVAPLARMYLTLKGNEPSVLFERFNDLLRGTARGISAKWTATAAHEGTLEFTYDGPVDPLLVHGWRGAMRYVLKFCRREGDVVAQKAGADGRSLSVLISWT
jgi:hypothetical protein